LKLWIIDADLIIDFLALEILDKLVQKHTIFLATSVIDEVKFYRKDGIKIQIDFRETYIESGLIKELEAAQNEIKEVLECLPSDFEDSIHIGELESLAILKREKGLIFCCCDHFAIRALPFIDCSDRGISTEKLLNSCGLSLPRSKLKDRHTEDYFQNNLRLGQEKKIYNF